MKNLNNKKVLVTGGAGFIGSHMVSRLVKLGAKVTTIVKYNSIIDSPRLNSMWNKIHVIESDLRNTDSVSHLKKYNFDIAFHFAAYNHVGDSFKHIKENIDSNLISTINLLNHGPKFKKFIHIGSSEIYGNQKLIPFNSKNKPNPMSPYAITKYASELYSVIKSRETNFNLISLRPFNTFGEYQSEKAIIPELIIKCLTNQSIDTTKGVQTREFNYIDNIIDGILFIQKKLSHHADPINIGSNKPIRIRDLVKKIKKITKSNSKIKYGALKYRPNEIWRMQADIAFLKKIGFKHSINFDEGLKRTVNWYKNFLKLYIHEKSILNKLSYYD